ncbi:hypothetical protein LUZ61_011168 [Rhynchospora tenuis]|uniref:non-specific serine/threonine protein kinase n=1 Tax=Rhynchospora tenuis TaxID=198213 RepID=A0AAD6A0Q0_9POAL|nr:hypothetical protein LUZ61_011168 [Rhynchospora tenuis]
MQICNQDLKLENLLLNGNQLDQLKICDFEYTELSMFRSSPHLTVGKLSYIPPEFLFFYDYRGVASKYVRYKKEVLHFLHTMEQKRSLSLSESNLSFMLEDHVQALSNAEADIHLRRCRWFSEQIDRAERIYDISDNDRHCRDEYNTQIPMFLATAELADVWSCGVALYLMLFGSYIFQDSNDVENAEKRIMLAQYNIPDNIPISQDCQELLARIFVANPDQRIKIQNIRQHPWFLKDLPEELSEIAQAVHYDTTHIHSLQTEEEIKQIVAEARNPPPSSPALEDQEQVVQEEEEDLDWFPETFGMPRLG